MTKTIGIVASGPSLTVADCAVLRGKCDQIIAINENWRVIKADHLYAADAHFWHLRINDILCGFSGEKWSCETPNKTNWGTRYSEEWGIKLLECDISAPGLSRDPTKVHGGGNSGYQAIGLARHLMPEGGRIILLGYDMTWTGGRSHWHGDHPKGLNNIPPDRYQAAFRTIKPEDYNLEIINCTRSTALDAFPIVPLEDV